jgi:hypothetical protein
MKKKRGFRLIVLTIGLAIGCFSLPKLHAYGQGVFDYELMDFRHNVSSRILALDNNLRGNLSIQQNNRIMKNGFLVPGTESHGYFRITLSSQYIGEGKNNKAYMALGLLSIFTIPIGGYTIFPLPSGQAGYQLTATVEFYDCHKRLIAEYERHTTFDGVTKHDLFGNATDDYTQKSESLYYDLLKECLLTASRDADKINAALINVRMSERIPAGARIAVIGANQNPDVIQGARRIEAQLIETRRFQIVDRVSIDRIIDEIMFSRSVFVSEAIEVGRMLAAQYIAYVEITGEGANRKLNFRVLSVVTGEVIASFALL